MPKFLQGESVRCGRVILGTLPCVLITSLNQDANIGDKCQFRHDEAHGQPSKTSKKRSVALLEDSYTICLCVSRFSSEKIHSTEKGEYWDQIAPSSFPRARSTTSKFGKVRVHREELSQKCETHERNPCAFGFEERTQDETLHQERCARRMSTGSQIRSKLRFTLLLNPGQRQHPRQNLQRSENSCLSSEHQCIC